MPREVLATGRPGRSSALPLTAVTPLHLQSLYANRLAAGCSATSVRHLHRFLHRVFADAARWSVVPDNPVARATPPRVARHRTRPLSRCAGPMPTCRVGGLRTRGAWLGLPRARFQDLRHTAATLLLQQGVHPKAVSELLGRTDVVAITLDLYSHVSPAMHEAAARALGERLA